MIPRECSTSELATVLGLTVQAVGRLSDKNVLPRIARGRYDLSSSVVVYIKYREQIAAQRAGGDGETSYSAARTKAMWERATLAEHKRKEREGQFFAREEVRRTWGTLGGLMRTTLLAIPSRLALQLSRISSPSECEAVLRKAVNGALNQLASTRFERKGKEHKDDEAA
jgi:phage terminase Nu1 subunit (DNA packaging protein)